jgi:hypothetical protein
MGRVTSTTPVLPARDLAKTVAPGFSEFFSAEEYAESSCATASACTSEARRISIRSNTTAGAASEAMRTRGAAG